MRPTYCIERVPYFIKWFHIYLQKNAFYALLKECVPYIIPANFS